MDILNKAGNAVGDAVARARERERIRLEDRIGLLERIAEAGRAIVLNRGGRPGYTWDQAADDAALKMVADATAVNDPDLIAAVDALASIDPPWVGNDEPAPKAELQAAYRVVVVRLGELRREALEPD